MPKIISLDKARRHDAAQDRLMKAANDLHGLSSAKIDKARWERIGFILADLELAHRDLGETL